MATRSFLIQLDDDEMEYHAVFDPQKFAEAFLDTAAKIGKEQKMEVLDIEVKYLGAN